MKKFLMGTTAIIALASFTSQAAAAEKIALGLGGFQKAYLGKISRTETTDTHADVGGYTDTEVYFTGSTTLDNGVTVAATIQLEADGGSSTHTHSTDTTDGSGATATATAQNGGNVIDASYMTISSDAMGAAQLGSVAGTADQMSIGAPSIGPVGLGDGGDWDSEFSDNAGYAGYNSDDSVKLNYFSPDFNGMQVGFTYTIGANFGGASDGRNAPHAQTQDLTQLVVAYSGEMSGAAVGVTASYEDDNAANNEAYGFGVEVGMNNITVGGAYTDFSNTAGDATADGSAYELGVAYESGAMGVAATYGHGSVDTAVKSKSKMWILGASYDLGAGVGLVGEYYSAKTSDAASASTSTSGVIAGIEVGF